MSTLNILTVNDNEPALRQKSQLISNNEITKPDMQKFFESLKETMYKKDGVGLAAPQVGQLLRVVCVNMENNIAKIFINPHITKKSWLKTIMEEGCLSIPGIYGKVKRPKKITVSYQNRQGESITEKMSPLASRIIQHEIDHLDGILFTDKIIK